MNAVNLSSRSIAASTLFAKLRSFVRVSTSISMLVLCPLMFKSAVSVAQVQFSSYNFGGVNVGSNSTATLNFNISSNITLGANPSITTQGTSGLDFTMTSTTCSGPQTAPTTCSVTVQFAPTVPGPRYGAVQILDASGNLLFITFLQGLGVAPAVAFAGGAQSVVPVSGLTGPNGIALDAAGDIFVVDKTNNVVLELPEGCTNSSCQLTIATGLNNPQGVAVDGAGDVFIADSLNNQVLEVPAGCASSSCQTTVGVGPFTPSGVAVDGMGDVFIADSLNNQVLEVPAGCASSSCQTTVGVGPFTPSGVAVDGMGDVFIADSLNNQVLEVPAGCTASGCQVSLGSGLSDPSGITVDAAGDIFVADTNNNRVLEIPIGCTSSSCQANVGSGLSSPAGVVVDGAGDVFIADFGNTRVVVVQNSQASPLSFASTPISARSSAQTVIIQNIGSASLAFSSFTASTNFAVDSSTTTCSTSSSYSLAPGATCNVGVACAPTMTGTLTGTLTLSDNALNGFPTTQQVSLSCAGSGTAPIISSGNNATFTVGALGTFVVNTSGVPTPSLSESGSLPSGVTFQDDGNGTATLSGIPGADTGGAYNIVITAANGISSNATQSFTLTVDQPPTITSASSITFTLGSAGQFTVTTTGYPTPSFSAAGATLPSGVTFVDNQNGTATLGGTPAIGTAGTYNFTITAQNGISSNATQSFTLTVQSNTVSAMVAARFLEQSSWGPTAATIAQVQQGDLSTYLQQQFNAPISTYPTASSLVSAQEQFFINAMQGQDQLRQRVSFALSEIMVVSYLNSTVSITPNGFSLWMNTLQNDVFGNFFQLLNDVTLSPTMGSYLNMARNNGCSACHPNENYAREIMQLFTIGLDELNQDGSLVLDQNGNPIPTYSQNTIDSFSQVFTGWSYPPGSGKTALFTDSPAYTGPMVPFQANYNQGSKTLLNGTTLLAGGNIENDLQSALQNIFTHPNVAPFICKQLIQKLVTSNPIPDYVSRCSQVFNDDGTGISGNMQAVISEILLDPEARRGDDPSQVLPTDGHLREPLLFMMLAMRALNATTNGANLANYAANMGQEPFEAPSVFNFYPPNYEIPGTGILGPEFKILNANSTVNRINFINQLIYSKIAGTTINISPYVTVAGNVSALLNMINANLMHGAMPSDMYNTLLETLSNKAFTTPTSSAEAALYLVETSSQFQVED